jgi:hypothetical protein
MTILPEWTRFTAVDIRGEMWAFYNMPVFHNGNWNPCHAISLRKFVKQVDIPNNASKTIQEIN